MTIHEHQGWYDSFHRRHGGFRPSGRAADWMEDCDRTHTELRKMLGGVRVHRTYELGEDTGRLTDEQVFKFYVELESIIKTDPGYTDAMQADLYHLIPSRHLAEQYRRTDHHYGTKTSKWITSQLRCLTLYSETRKSLDKWLSKLGEAWGRLKGCKDTVSVTLSTSPKAFALVGHYGPDRESCFRQGASRTSNKYMLAVTPQTFVVVIRGCTDDQEEEDCERNLVRCWGWWEPEGDVWNVANFYFASGTREAIALRALKKLFTELSGKDVHFFEDKMSVREIVYHNEYLNWSFSSEKTISDQYLDAVQVKSVKCPSCGEAYDSDEDFSEVDGELVCTSCYEGSNRCDRCDCNTTQDLTSVRYVSSGGLVRRRSWCEHCVSDDSTICDDCGEQVDNDCFSGDTNICLSCAAAREEEEAVARELEAQNNAQNNEGRIA